MNRRFLGLLIVISLFAPAVFAQNIIRCESDRGRRHDCTFSGWGRVGLSRQLSRTACVEGHTWGTSGRNTIWVSNGCRADFLITRNRDDRNRDDNPNRHRATVVCESDFHSRHHCAIDTRSGVQLSRQLSRVNCVLNRTWGYDSRGIWVKDGCRAEFLVGR